MKFGRVLDATLMMDKDTGRPRGFGFVTFDSELAVERTLEGPLAILGKPIEVKRAQPRGKMGEEEPQYNKLGGRAGRGGFQGGGGGGFNSGGNQMANAGGNGDTGNANNMTPAMMAQYWQRMQQYFAAMQSGMMVGGGMGGMNPMMMQQMMAQRAQQGQMNPQQMQQMQQMQQQMAAMQGGGVQAGGNSPTNGGAGSGFSAQEQLMFEQQKYERQQMARMQTNQQYGGQNTWDGMYDDVPAPDIMQGPAVGGRGGSGGGGGGFRGGRGGGGGGFNRQQSATPAANAPANAPTGPKNAGRPGANYRGGGRGGHRGFHPYARGGG